MGLSRILPAIQAAQKAFFGAISGQTTATTIQVTSKPTALDSASKPVSESGSYPQKGGSRKSRKYSVKRRSNNRKRLTLRRRRTR